MPENRDPGTGKLTAWGYTERVAKIASILLIPILLWTVRVEVFMQRGPRFTEDDAETLALTMQKQWRTELQDAVKEGQLPVAALRLDSLEDNMVELRVDLKEIRETVQKNSQKLTAIEILLKDGR